MFDVVPSGSSAIGIVVTSLGVARVAWRGRRASRAVAA